MPHRVGWILLNNLWIPVFVSQRPDAVYPAEFFMHRGEKYNLTQFHEFHKDKNAFIFEKSLRLINKDDGTSIQSRGITR